MIFKNRQDNDPFFNNVSLLLHMDGANGSTTFTDSSSNNFAVTANGNAQISSAQSKFGGSSALFDGAGDYLQVGSSTIQALQFPADFTLEMWYYPLSLSIDQCLYDASLPAQSSTRADGFALAINTSGQMYFFHNGAPSYTSSHPTINTWNHIVVSRSGSALRVFLNGNIVLTLTNSVNFSRGGALIGTVTETLEAYAINGYIDELRVTKEVAIYTGNFTPPTTPFPDREIKRTIFKKNGSNKIIFKKPKSSCDIIFVSNAGTNSVNGTYIPYSTVTDGSPPATYTIWTKDGLDSYPRILPFRVFSTLWRYSLQTQSGITAYYGNGPIGNTYWDSAVPENEIKCPSDATWVIDLGIGLEPPPTVT